MSAVKYEVASCVDAKLFGIHWEVRSRSSRSLHRDIAEMLDNRVLHSAGEVIFP